MVFHVLNRGVGRRVLFTRGRERGREAEKGTGVMQGADKGTGVIQENDSRPLLRPNLIGYRYRGFLFHYCPHPFYATWSRRGPGLAAGHPASRTASRQISRLDGSIIR